MDVKCGNAKLYNQHIVLALRFRADGTYDLNTILSDKLFVGMEDEVGEIFLKGIAATLSELGEWSNNKQTKEAQQ